LRDLENYLIENYTTLFLISLENLEEDAQSAQ